MKSQSQLKCLSKHHHPTLNRLHPLCSRPILGLHPCSLTSSYHSSSLSALLPRLLSSALALIQCVPTSYICSTPSFTPNGRESQVLHSLTLFTQTKSCSISVTKPTKSLWLFHVLSAHGSLLSPGYWPGPWIQ